MCIAWLSDDDLAWTACNVMNSLRLPVKIFDKVVVTMIRDTCPYLYNEIV